MRALCALTFSALFLLSCASGGKQKRDDNEAPAEESSGEGDCLRKIVQAYKHFCLDRPGELGEGFGAGARARYDELAQSCEGPRSRRGLREIDECVASYESDPSQVDNETHDRLEAEKPRAATLRSDEVFLVLLRKLRSLRDDANSAAAAYKVARASGDENERSFRKNSCETAEHDLKEAENELREALRKADIDVRDRHALGLW